MINQKEEMVNRKLKKILKIVSCQLSIVSCKSGQSLIEILIAIGLTGILLPALLTGLVASREGKAQENQRLQAAALLKESEEAIRSIREKGWTNISTNGTYDVAVSGSEWVLTPCPCPQISGYSRQVVIADAQRDANGNIVDSGGTLDPSTKKITATVSWQTPFASSLELISYYQRYLGNAVWVQTTDADFNAGTHNNTQTVGSGSSASVELTQSAGGGGEYGNKFRVEATSAIGNMTTTTTKTSLRFTAQESKTVNAIRVYLHTESRNSPAYRYGLQANSAGDLPSGTYLTSGTLTATSEGWKTIAVPAYTLTAGGVYHIVVEPQGSPSNRDYIALRQSSPLNNLYPKTNTPDPKAAALFTSDGLNWSQGSQPIYELDFSDSTYEGNPYESNLEVAVFGANFVGEKFTFDKTDQTATDISFYVRRQGNPGADLDVELSDTASGQTFTCSIPKSQIGGSYSYQSCTFSSPITLKQNTTYRIYLRSIRSSSGKDYRIQRIETTNFTNFNLITYDATNSVYTSSNDSGGSWADANNWDIGGFYFTVQGSTTYPSSGQFTSQLSANFGNVAFNNITWTASTPAGTSISLEVSIDGGAYIGPFTSPSAIPLPNINGSTIRFRATLTSDGTQTPTLNDVSINYSP